MKIKMKKLNCRMKQQGALTAVLWLSLLTPLAPALAEHSSRE